MSKLARTEIAPFIARERYAWPGGYEMFAVTDDLGILCNDCCATQAETIADAFPGDGWYVVAYDATCNTDGEITCDHCYRTVQLETSDC